MSRGRRNELEELRREDPGGRLGSTGDRDDQRREAGDQPVIQHRPRRPNDRLPASAANVRLQRNQNRPARERRNDAGRGERPEGDDPRRPNGHRAGRHEGSRDRRQGRRRRGAPDLSDNANPGTRSIRPRDDRNARSKPQPLARPRPNGDADRARLPAPMDRGDDRPVRRSEPETLDGRTLNEDGSDRRIPRPTAAESVLECPRLDDHRMARRNAHVQAAGVAGRRDDRRSGFPMTNHRDDDLIPMASRKRRPRPSRGRANPEADGPRRRDANPNIERRRDRSAFASGRGRIRRQPRRQRRDHPNRLAISTAGANNRDAGRERHRGMFDPRRRRRRRDDDPAEILKERNAHDRGAGRRQRRNGLAPPREHGGRHNGAMKRNAAGNADDRNAGRANEARRGFPGRRGDRDPSPASAVLVANADAPASRSRPEFARFQIEHKPGENHGAGLGPIEKRGRVRGRIINDSTTLRRDHERTRRREKRYSS